MTSCSKQVSDEIAHLRGRMTLSTDSVCSYVLGQYSIFSDDEATLNSQASIEKNNLYSQPFDRIRKSGERNTVEYVPQEMKGIEARLSYVETQLFKVERLMLLYSERLDSLENTGKEPSQ